DFHRIRTIEAIRRAWRLHSAARSFGSPICNGVAAAAAELPLSRTRLLPSRLAWPTALWPIARWPKANLLDSDALPL
ncbi:hypothetical protein, partial [Stenotrophomonas maltophilia]|uniref:hypothetical protein n=1 Tax=Stenotrophomonas maltophilia TaxID=40324 RepID=UPI001953A011